MLLLSQGVLGFENGVLDLVEARNASKGEVCCELGFQEGNNGVFDLRSWKTHKDLQDIRNQRCVLIPIGGSDAITAGREKPDRAAVIVQANVVEERVGKL